MQFPGQAVGSGLTFQASGELGLLEGTVVATSLIDAHAGGLGKWVELLVSCFFLLSGLNIGWKGLSSVLFPL